jgi:hypothetical protein
MRLITVCAALVVGACSNEPTAAPTAFPPQPSSPVNVNGTWLTAWTGGGIGHFCTGTAAITAVQAAGSGTFTGTYSGLNVTCDGWTGNTIAPWSASDTVVPGQLVFDANNNIEQAGPTWWAPRAAYTVGQKVMDSNNNLEQCTIAGTSVVTPPKWNKTLAGTTVDGNSSPWKASTQFAKGTLIVDPNNNIDSATVTGTSGSLAPTWSLTAGGSTTDSTITWINVGPAATWTNLGANATGTTAPTWSTTAGGTTTDGSVTWTNNGPLAATPSVGTVTGTVSGYNVTMDLTNVFGAGATIHQSGIRNDANPTASPWTASTLFLKGAQIVDPNNNIEQASDTGTSAATAPTWNQTVGGTTADGAVLKWTNLGTRFQLLGTSTWSNANYKMFWIVTSCGNTVFNALGCSHKLSVAADTARMATVTSNWVATSH